MADTGSISLPISARQRRWSLVAAISSVTGFGLSIGQGAPLLSLLLESHGADASLNGLNAASAFVGVLIGPLLTPLGIRTLGQRNLLLLCYALEVAICPLLKTYDSLGAWFALRALSGMCGSSIFTASESWINSVAGDAGRGRIIGVYAAALCAGFGIGPLLLSITGIQGWTPFIANAAIIFVSALPLLMVGDAESGFEQSATHPLRMIPRAPLVIGAVALFGLYEATLMALLPIWALREGFSPRLAAATLSAVYLGSVAMQWPIGWISDKTARLTMLRLAGMAALLGAVTIAAIASPSLPLFVTVAVWGGVTSSIYPVALSMAGDQFRGSDLVAINAAIIIAYGVGGLAGPGLGGAAMDLAGPAGLFWFFMLLFMLFLGATMFRPERPARLTQS